MGRTKRATTTRRPAQSSSTLARMSSIAFGYGNIENSNVLQSGSPPNKNVNKKEIIRNFKKEVKADLEAYEEKIRQDIEQLQITCDMLKFQIPVEIANVPLKCIKHYREKYVTWKLDDFPEMPVQNPTNDSPENPNVDGNPFKKPLLPKRNTRRTRNSKMSTPVNKVNYVPSVITPKVNMNRPLSALRHARVGEQAVSMSGSPIMVTSMPPDDVATVSVPVNDGRVFTILPTSNFEPEQLPLLDNQTKEQLETLYRNLAWLFTNKEVDNNEEDD